MKTARFKVQRLPLWRRAVIKVGSSLVAGDSGLSTRYASAIGLAVSRLISSGHEVLLVSSGAVAAGRAVLGSADPKTSNALPARQALAALGQVGVVALWQRFFDQPVAQVLLTHDDLRNRRRYLNARATLRGLLALGAVPVINENDTVAVDELKLGDNDNLAAHVAILMQADLLVLLSDVDGLFDRDPRRDAQAQPILRVRRITPALRAAAGGAGSNVGTGGMATKLDAAARAGEAGITTVVINGTSHVALEALQTNRLIGTRFDHPRSRVAARKTWLKNLPPAAGRLLVDSGAAKAIAERGASLLPRGLVAVHGEFARGDAVQVTYIKRGVEVVVARGLCQYNASECNRLIGTRSDEIGVRLGYAYTPELVHRDDLVLLNPRSAT
ncbi:MAG: glutamate 5-kinase [Gammaproteobacteria bacterium HGW-Gammaproteobacteria-5]|nr:MAG: glutamate 5-kinase [Gammaproteobacteria bacterium HGW-Gammaproteobacteria-5]